VGGEPRQPQRPHREGEARARGREPTWGGFLPQFLGFELCQKILDVLTSTDEPAYLGDEALRVLRNQRDNHAEVLKPGRGGVKFDGDEIRWWTFAAGRINSTLRYALQALNAEWRVVPDNFLVKIRGGLQAGPVPRCRSAPR